jgi:4-hydroxy-tetrahydrodipicolinate synthase
MYRFYGAITALVTPFTVKGQVDITALKNLVDFQIRNGINALVPCGSTGEAATMAIEEYELVIKTVIDQTRKRVPIIVGAGSNDTQKAIVFSMLAKKAGVDGLLHVTPFYNKPTIKGLIAHFKAIANAVDLPIILYNVPGRTGLNLTASVTLQIAKEVEQVVGIKEASGNVMQVMDIIHKKSKNFAVLSGDDALTLPMIVLGAVGCISVVANEVPRLFSQLVTMALKGNFAKAQKIHYQLLDLMNINFIETNPIPVKTALSLMGKIQEEFRLPLVTMEGKHKEKLVSIMKGVGLV